MKPFSKLFALFTIVFSQLSSGSLAYAQKNEPPTAQFGIGVYAISNFIPSGIEGIYAINTNLQVGTEFSLAINSGIWGGNTILFAPFIRYAFPSNVSPFIEGGFQLINVSVGGGSTTNSGIYIGAGVAYYLNHEIGVHGGVDIINTFFSPSGTSFGWSNVRVGADWFF